MHCVRNWAGLSALVIATFACSAKLWADSLPEPPRPDSRILVPEEVKGLLESVPRGLAGSGQPEVITERYPNRVVKIERHVKMDDDRNYVNHGPWKMWDSQGQLIAEGHYRLGKRHGKWKQRMPQLGSLRHGFAAPFSSDADFADGELHGVWAISDSQGRPVVSWGFRRGNLHGTMIGWYSQGQKKFEATFAQGKPHGSAVYWTADGRERKKEQFEHGDQRIASVSWYDTKQKETEGWLLRTNVTFGVEADWWNGVLIITRDDSEAKDLKTGVWSEWHPNGTLRFAGKFQGGQPNGTHTWWHANGQKMMIGKYQSGAPAGRWTRWHGNGRKHEEGAYLAGNKQGTWTVWDEEGNVADVQDLNEELELDNPFGGEAHSVAFPGDARDD